MKRAMHKQPLIAWPPSRRRNRWGGIFNYYLMYMLLTGVMISTAGISLHIVLRSGVKDDASAFQLRTLVRLERQLRSDQTAAYDVALDDTTLSFRTGNDERVDWTMAGNIVTRIQTRQDEVTGRDRFVLLWGSRVVFLPTSETSITIRIAEPVRNYARTQPNHDGTVIGDELAEVSDLPPTLPFVDIIVTLPIHDEGPLT
jgi:hypothetical protein